jgi:HD-like signal output (HDOD) protein
LNAELSLFGVDHTEIGAKMLQFWNFDKHLCDAIAYHHSPIFAFSNPMGHLAWAANHVAHLTDGLASDDAKITEKTFRFLKLEKESDFEKIRSVSLQKVDDFQKKLEAIL